MRSLCLVATSLLALACVRIGPYPIHALRTSPPSGIEQRATQVGALAPDWAARSRTTVLVFYRGFW